MTGKRAQLCRSSDVRDSVQQGIKTLTSAGNIVLAEATSVTGACADEACDTHVQMDV